MKNMKFVFASLRMFCISGTVGIQLRNSRDGLVLTTDRPVSCHQNPSSSEKQLIFRLNKNGRVESDQHFNEWAKQCQTRSVQKLLKVNFEEYFFIKKKKGERKPYSNSAFYGKGEGWILLLHFLLLFIYVFSL